MGVRPSRILVTDPSELARDGEYFDYIIVGAGAAGPVIANRLSENPHNKVLLVEAGKDNEGEQAIVIPSRWGTLMKGYADWDYDTAPQANMDGRQLYWTRGKILGGSTALNCMIYQHATPQDFEEWEANGATGWGPKEMTTYYHRAENFTANAQHPKTSHDNHGNTGPWLTGYQDTHPNTDHFIQSAVNAGIPQVDDLCTAEGGSGVSQFVTFIDGKGRRSSTATAFLPHEVVTRPNLTVAVEIRTNRIILEERANAPPKCVGIEVSNSAGGQRYEILLCSGVGPADALQAAKIPMKVNSEQVGRNLRDHLASFIQFRAHESYDFIGHPIKSLPAVAEWYANGTGPLVTNGGESAAFIRLNEIKALTHSSASKLPEQVVNTSSGPGSPDLEILNVNFFIKSHGFIPPPPETNGFTLVSIHLRPESHGRVTVTSNNVWDKAICDPRYLDSEVDVHAQIRGIRATLRIAHTKPLKDALIFQTPDPKREDPFWFTDSDPDVLTDEEISSHVRKTAETLYHPVGTARIGTSIENGVVDAQLRVFGIEGLRIADASIFPNQISAHPCATVVAIGEKAADLIAKAA